MRRTAGAALVAGGRAPLLFSLLRLCQHLPTGHQEVAPCLEAQEVRRLGAGPAPQTCKALRPRLSICVPPSPSLQAGGLGRTRAGGGGRRERPVQPSRHRGGAGGRVQGHAPGGAPRREGARCRRRRHHCRPSRGVQVPLLALQELLEGLEGQLPTLQDAMQREAGAEAARHLRRAIDTDASGATALIQLARAALADSTLPRLAAAAKTTCEVGTTLFRMARALAGMSAASQLHHASKALEMLQLDSEAHAAVGGMVEDARVVAATYGPESIDYLLRLRGCCNSMLQFAPWWCVCLSSPSLPHPLHMQRTCCLHALWESCGTARGSCASLRQHRPWAPMLWTATWQTAGHQTAQRCARHQPAAQHLTTRLIPNRPISLHCCTASLIPAGRRWAPAAAAAADGAPPAPAAQCGAGRAPDQALGGHQRFERAVLGHNLFALAKVLGSSATGAGCRRAGGALGGLHLGSLS